MLPSFLLSFLSWRLLHYSRTQNIARECIHSGGSWNVPKRGVKPRGLGGASPRCPGEKTQWGFPGRWSPPKAETKCKCLSTFPVENLGFNDFFFKSSSLRLCDWSMQELHTHGWRRGSVVRTSSVAGGLSLIYAWSMVDVWPLRG